MAEFICGFVGGVCNVVVSHPFDLLKTRLQSKFYKTSFEAVKTILAAEGVGGLYRGVFPVLLGAGPIMGICYTSFSWTSHFVSNSFQITGDLPIHFVMLAGSLAAIPTSFFLAPCERLKILLQIQTGKITRFSLANLNATILRSGGYRQLFRGVGITICRDFPGDAAYFGTFIYMKRLFGSWDMLKNRKNAYSDSDTLSPYFTVLAGGLAGCANWLVCMPLDVIKTRHQQGTGTLGFLTIIREIGLRDLYRGIGPVLLRGIFLLPLAFPASGAFFLGVETTRAVIFQ